MNTDRHQKARRPLLQFGIGTILVITTVLAVLLGTLKSLGVSPRATMIVLVVLAVSVVAGVGLVVALAAAVGGDDDDRP